MDDKIFDSIVQGAKEGLAYLKGDASGVAVHHFHNVDAENIKRVRSELSMTQKQFAENFGFSLDSLKNWEAGRRTPDTSAQTLIKVIAHNPKVVMEALHHA